MAKLDLCAWEVTTILKALQEQPYSLVASIIHKITNQLAADTDGDEKQEESRRCE